MSLNQLISSIQNKLKTHSENITALDKESKEIQQVIQTDSVEFKHSEQLATD